MSVTKIYENLNKSQNVFSLNSRDFVNQALKKKIIADNVLPSELSEESFQNEKPKEAEETQDFNFDDYVIPNDLNETDDEEPETLDYESKEESETNIPSDDDWQDFGVDDYEYVEYPEEPAELQKTEKTLRDYVRKYGWRFVSYVPKPERDALIRVQEICLTECEKLLKETLEKYCVQDKRKTYKTEQTLRDVLRVFEKGFVIKAINRLTLSSGLKTALLKKLETIVLDKRPPLGFILKKIERQKDNNSEFLRLEALWKK